MARSYRPTTFRRAINSAVRPLAKRGLAGSHVYVLTVRGRKTGKRYETPVTLIEDGDRWLVAPYGEVNWVRNVRAAGEVELTRARRTETLRIEEAAAEQAAPVLRRYLKAVAVVRPFFDVKPDSTTEEFIREAPRHPVFRLTQSPSQ
ncbi:MAG: nitroreductase family deazaflavin-dependent oxidoreductase [Solirubrobacterales bacterium]|nr:nitroreductase family deazaflavin-dependent oxidoreductase [Solirubrobacterales bacterium]